MARKQGIARTNSVARTIHDLGLATWFGGSLMGAVGLNAAAREVSNPAQRSKVANAGWARWTPANLAAIGGYILGSTVLTKGNKGRLAGQHGVGRLAMVKTALSGVTLAATAYSRILGERVMRAGEVPVEDGTTPGQETPEDVARAQRQLKVLQWAIPAHVAALIAINSRMGETQRPGAVARGVVQRLRKAA